ncbi:MAG: DUF4115 domain-containing protein, partial [Anaerolineaceae bacterium]|nr:DUF4115 domain-containing protein [Anaerolineaceae bacterium]
MTGSIGEQLKQARIEKGLSLEQVTQATHIRMHYLEALEGDERSALPSNVQGRGFLRLYAGLLDLPFEPLLAAWDGKPEPVETLTQVGLTAPDQPLTETSPEDKEPQVNRDFEEKIPQTASTGTEGEDSPAIFREIGEKLRLQRETLGLSLAEVERYTRLRQHYITAMEEGQMDNMPSYVQGRGMLSNYAAFLNLNEEKILLRFAEGLQARRIERIPKVLPGSVFGNKKKIARQAPVWRRFLTPDLIFGVGLAAIILFFILWTAARIDTFRNTSAEPTTPAISEMLLTPVEMRTISAVSTDPSQLTLAASENTSQAPISAETPTAPFPTATLPLAQISTGVGQPDITATIPPNNEDPLQVYIVAKQRAWLRIIADDKVKFLGRVVPGNAYAFSGAKKVELLTGNAAGLQIFFNQSDLGTLGKMGEVVGLVFVPEGMMTPTPAFPATGTPTQIATITALPTA